MASNGRAGDDYTRMNGRAFLCVRGGNEQKIDSVPQLTTLMEAATAASSGVVTMELRKGEPPKRWEKVIYPMLGLKVPITASVLAAYWNGERALVTFEDGEKEWVARSEAVSASDALVEFKTEASEQFSVPVGACIQKAKALQLLEEFFQTQKRPVSAKWTTSKR